MTPEHMTVLRWMLKDLLDRAFADGPDQLLTECVVNEKYSQREQYDTLENAIDTLEVLGY